MKVEQALATMPDLEALAPLRALLVSSSTTRRNSWATSGQNLTVGKREVSLGEMRQRMAQGFAGITQHLSRIFELYVRSLECLEEGDAAAAAEQLLRAGTMEEGVGRLAQARAWFESALALAEGLSNRKPEVETLLSVGRLSTCLGAYDDAARQYQRAFILADGGLEQTAAIDACEGLGNVMIELAVWSGGHAWFSRGLRLAESAGDQLRAGRLHLGLGELARRTGELTTASDELRWARERFEIIGDTREMARVLLTQGLVEHDLGISVRAASAYREALAWTHRGDPDPGLEVFIRLNFARLHVDEQRFLDAEEELRRAEQLAIAAGLMRRLAQIYSLFGRMRGLQGDESGFVFFEQAIQLARMLDRFPRVEAQVYHEYGVFKASMKQPDESRAYLERAREIFETVGASAELDRVNDELHRLSA
jgi:tetratricopeptide (TPR) repeat protein